MYKPVKCPDAAIQAKIDRLPKLNPKAKKRWVDALLSGKYRQGSGSLRDSTQAYCCLGVACDVFKGDVKADWRGTIFLGGTTYLPGAVSLVMGARLDADDFTVYYNGAARCLSHLNDDGVPFDMIAGLIINQL